MYIVRRKDDLLKGVKEPLFKTRRQRVNARNKVMASRYYYWTEIRRLRFDDVIRILSEAEFFVEDRTISNALLEYSDYLNELHRGKSVIGKLKKEFPSWSWK